MEDLGTVRSAADAVADARRDAARAMAALAAATVRYADVRTATDPAPADLTRGSASRHRPKPGEFVADELSLLLREQPYQVRCLVARTRRLTTCLPTVWDAYTAGISTPTRSG